MALTYRRATEADRAGVMAVLATANFQHIPSPEMPELDLSLCYVAEEDGTIVGVAGFKILEEGGGKTTLMAVDPSQRGRGLGLKLQTLRMEAMKRAGCRSVVTNADRPSVIAWYEKHFGYRQIGALAKEHEFGDPEVDHWTTLEADLTAWEPDLEAE